MDPLTPNDPLWKLLGQAKPVEPRPNFTQNVMRQARQTPQERGLLCRLRAWFETSGSMTSRIAWAGAAAAITLLAVLPLLREPAVEVVRVEKIVAPVVVAVETPLADFPLLPESDTQWETMEQFDALLAVQDTSELTDREIHFLLY